MSKNETTTITKEIPVVIQVSQESTQGTENTAPAFPIMLTIKQAAEKFGLSQHFTRSLVLQKKVYSISAGRKYLINERSLCDFLNGEGV